MSFFVYILYSSLLDRYYVGHTSDLEGRLYRHCNSGSRSTKGASDWKLLYTEEFSSRSAACIREKEIKGRKSRRYIEQLVLGKS